MMKLLAVLIGLVLFSSVFTSSYAYIPSEIILDPLPSKVKRGDVVKITGVFKTQAGTPLAGKFVNLVSGYDNLAKTHAWTDSNGKFVLTWTVGQTYTTYKWYVSYVGDLDALYTESKMYSVLVDEGNLRQPAVISIDPIPTTVNRGDVVKITGILSTSDGKRISGKPVNMVNSETGQILTTTMTDSNGQFIFNWTVGYSRDVYHWVTEFRGDDEYDYTKSEVRTSEVVTIEESKVDKMSYKIFFITGSQYKCSEKNILALEYYEWITDQYLTKYHIPHEVLQAECVKQVDIQNNLSEFGKKLVNVDLPIIIFDALLGLEKEVLGNNAWGHYQIRGGLPSHIVICACSPFVESDFGGWLLSHELAHFTLHYSDQKFSIVKDWVHNMQSEKDECFADDYTLNSCPKLWDTVKAPSNKNIKVMKVYGGESPPAKFVPYEHSLSFNENEESDVPTTPITSTTPMTSTTPITPTTPTTPTTLTTPTTTQKTTTKLPNWIKNNAGWWSSGAIEDRDFSKGIEYMIKEEIIRIPQVQTEKEMGTFSVGKIPDWIKNNAKWWSEGKISDDDFSKGIEYMVKVGIIKI